MQEEILSAGFFYMTPFGLTRLEVHHTSLRILSLPWLSSKTCCVDDNRRFVS